MEVILLERVTRLGQMGDVVRVKDGFARNFLLPRGKALRATSENRTRFEAMKSELQVRSQTLKTEAVGIADKLNGKSFTVLRQASEAGQLFGSVSPRDLVHLITDAGLRHQPQSDRAEHAYQNDRPAQCTDRAPPRNRNHHYGDRCPQRRRGGTDCARRRRIAAARRADRSRSGSGDSRGLF